MDVTSFSLVRRVIGRFPITFLALVPVVVAMVAAGVATAALLAPEPFSDWAYYWQAAGDPSRYERGGILMLALGLVQRLGLAPHWSALIFNLPFALALVWLVYRVDPLPSRPFALATASALLLLAPYLSLVQLDLSASVLLGAGMVLLLPGSRAGSSTHRRWRAGAGWGLLAIACSTRPQFVLVLPVLAVLLVALGALKAESGRRRPWFLAAGLLTLGAVAGFAIDSGLRLAADRGEAVRSTSGVTLYAGLLASPAGSGCGRWSPEATRMARADLDRSVPEAVRERLSAQPAAHWASVVGCKLPAIVLPEGFAMGWVLASPNVAPRLTDAEGGDPIRHLWRIAWAEDRLWRLFALAGYVAAIALAVGGGFAGAMRWVPLAWLAAFWSVHVVFEIQGRYFLATLALLPLLIALALRRRPDEGRKA